MNESETKAATFKRGDLVKKKRGSQWRGSICGEYSTDHTLEGYCVKSHFETNSVQVFPVDALEPWDGE